jgi:hypothetical protein
MKFNQIVRSCKLDMIHFMGWVRYVIRYVLLESQIYKLFTNLTETILTFSTCHFRFHVLRYQYSTADGGRRRELRPTASVGTRDPGTRNPNVITHRLDGSAQLGHQASQRDVGHTLTLLSGIPTKKSRGKSRPGTNEPVVLTSIRNLCLVFII